MSPEEIALQLMHPKEKALCERLTPEDLETAFAGLRPGPTPQEKARAQEEFGRMMQTPYGL